jgi:GAF domain-containing protein
MLGGEARVPMNIDRLLRDIESRLEHLPAEIRREVRDTIREEAARARRRLDLSGTVEAERERRIEAETLREVLEAINRQARLEDTIDEVLRQLVRVVEFDSCSLGLIENGSCRIIAAKGFPESSKVVGLRFRAPIIDEIRERHWPVSLPDVGEDARFVVVEGAGAPIRSWAGLPLLVEGEVIGILNLDRHRVDPFSEEDLHRARAVAFSAAAAIRNAQILEQVRGYAHLMEQVVALDQAVFARRPPDEVRAALLRGALRLGGYAWGLLIEKDSRPPRVSAGSEAALAAAVGRAVPAELWTHEMRRLAPAETTALARQLDLAPPQGEIILVPLAADDEVVAVLALLDTDGDTPADRLMLAYAPRAAAAFVHALAER